MTFADALRPARRYVWLYDVVLIVLGSLLIALSAQVSIRLPFSPVPVTGQTLAVLLIGTLLGRRRGSLAVLAYLMEGAAGLPIFANGAAGPAHLFGPTGGYLAGFVAAAYVTGWLAERGWDRRIGTMLLAIFVGNAVISVFGLLWLARFVGGEGVLSLGLYPFIFSDLVKAALVAGLLPFGWKLLRG